MKAFIKRILFVSIMLILLLASSCRNDIEDKACSADDFRIGIASGVSLIKLKNSIDVQESIELSRDIVIDLNGNSLTFTGFIDLASSDIPYTVRIINGTINANKETQFFGVKVSKNSALILEDIKLISDTSGIFISEGADNSSVSIIDSSVKALGSFGISANSIYPVDNADILIRNSVISTEGASDGDNTAILFDINGTVTIDISELIADRQTVVLRGGAGHSIKNSSIIVTGNNSKTANQSYIDKNWGRGNEVPLAALVIGNRRDTGNFYPASAELSEVTINAPDKNNADIDYHGIYVWQNRTDYPVKVSGSVRFSDNDKTNTDNMNGAMYSVIKLQ